MPRKLRICSGVVLVLCSAALAQDRPSLAERVRQANFWERHAVVGGNRYFMVAQPTAAELAQARALGVPASSFDAASFALGRPIEFRREADSGAIDEFGPGVLERRVADGVLAFTVGERDAFLAWGNFDGRHPERDKPFGVVSQWLRNGRWYGTSFRTGEPFGIYLRIRQSLPKSTWRITTGPNADFNELMHRTPFAPGGDVAEFVVTGTDWQTIPVIFNDKIKNANGQPANFQPFGGFALHPGDPGNKVELAWIRITDPGNHVYARRTLDLPAPAVSARMTLSSWDSEVYVDGRQVAGPWTTYAAMGVREIDLAPHLRTPGRHVVAIHSLNNYSELNTTGGVRCADGTFVPLSSWLPLKLDQGRWTPDPDRPHFTLGSPHAGPWKTATLAFAPDDVARFMQADYDDAEWAGLSGLTTSGVAPIGPPYFGLLAVDLPRPEKQFWQGAPAPRKHPIFSVREPVVLALTALRTGLNDDGQALQYALIDKQHDRELARETLSLATDRRHEFQHAGLPIGSYELQLKLLRGKTLVDERAYEFLVVGPLDQPVVADDDVLAGLTTQTVVDLDCTASPPAGTYGAFKGWAGKGKPYDAPLVEAPFGRFRETGPDNADCFSYKVRIPNPGRPHLLQVTYPDDRLRVHGFFYTEPSVLGKQTVGTNRCSIGVISGWPDAPSQSMKTATGIFWPVDHVGTVDVYTTRYSPDFPAAPAAAARIRILEIDGELPRFDVRDYPSQFKPIGVHAERGGYVLWPTHYNGKNNAGEASRYTSHERPDFYADWHSVASNFTRTLRFHGLNFYFAGQHMYGGTNFPSVFNDNDNGSGGLLVQSQHDWGGILAAVLGENECGFASSFEYINNARIVGQGVPSPAQLARGRPTLCAVTESGKAYPYTAGITELTPLPSWVHPEVQEMFLREIDEVVELYKEYPGWKGISLLCHTLCGPSYGIVGNDPLKIGYEDVAAERFEKETGLKIPIAADDPQRFAKRYAWVTSDAKNRDAWVQWRCDVLLELNRKVRDRIRAARPDCQLYLDISYPYRETDHEKIRMAADPETLRKYVMQWGWDVAAYHREPGMVVSTMVTSNLEKRDVTSGKPDDAPLTRATALEPNYLQFFSGRGRGGVHLYNIFTENWPLAEEGAWLWSGNGAWVGYHWPTEAAFNDYWTNTLARVHPSTVIYNWHDSNLDSRLEPGLRRFTRAWRPLPNGNYEPLAGEAFDSNVVIQRCVEKPDYFYIANPCHWSAQSTLTFAPGAEVVDLHTGRPVPMPDGVWKLDLGPYALQSFCVSEGAPTKSAVVVDAAAVRRLKARFANDQKLAESKGDAEFVQQVSLLERALGEGRFREVEETLRGGFEYHLARRRAKP